MPRGVSKVDMRVQITVWVKALESALPLTPASAPAPILTLALHWPPSFQSPVLSGLHPLIIKPTILILSLVLRAYPYLPLFTPTYPHLPLFTPI